MSAFCGTCRPTRRYRAARIGRVFHPRETTDFWNDYVGRIGTGFNFAKIDLDLKHWQLATETRCIRSWLFIKTQTGSQDVGCSVARLNAQTIYLRVIIRYDVPRQIGTNIARVNQIFTWQGRGINEYTTTVLTISGCKTGQREPRRVLNHQPNM